MDWTSGQPRRRAIALSVLKAGLWPALAGTLVGAGMAAALARMVASRLFGVTATDPLTYFSASLILIAIALAACWIPARRASHIAPIEALRHE